jgi:uncharacterized repeat protein (TIGR03809 family)
MAAKQTTHPYQSIALRWSNLADRRLRYYTELFQSGRWRRYFDEEQFLSRIRDVKTSAAMWDRLARGRTADDRGANL